MSFKPTSKRLSQSHKESKPPEILIRKPLHLAKTCPVETTSKPLPLSKEKTLTKKTNKKQELSPKLSEYFLDSGASLPKTRANDQAGRLDAGEPIGGFKPMYFSPSTLSSEEVSIEELKPKLCFESVEYKDQAFENSNLVGISKSQFLFRVPSSELNYEKFEVTEEVLEESHALKQWELWLKRKKYQQKRLSERLGRKPCELLLNQSENFRKVLEDKTMLLCAQIPEPDKWRGHPYRWRTEVRMGGKDRDYIDCPQQCPEYFPVRSKLSKGIIPEMEFVGVATAIQKEKGVFCKNEPKNTTSYNTFWEKSKYRNKRTNEFRKQMKKMKPHNIQMDELAVVGVKIQRENEKEEECSFVVPNAPEIVLSPPEESSDCEVSQLNYFRGDNSVLCLVINEDEIKTTFELDGSQNPSNTTQQYKWEIDFGSNPVGTLMEKTLKVENRGTMAVSYKWVPKPQKQTSKLPLCGNRSSWFFFNKNPGIFLPGQIHDLKFYYHSKLPGVQIENWYLETHPPLFEGDDNGRIILTAVSTNDCAGFEVQKLKAYINRRVSETIAGNIIKYLMYMVMKPKYGLCGIEYRSLFIEKDLFEFHNPKHYYHPDVVMELKGIFQEILQDQECEWDFSINSLLTVIETHTTGKVQDSLLCKIGQCARKLLKPAYMFEKKNKKYRMAYQILCEMANLIDEDHSFIENCFPGRKKEETSECDGSEEYSSNFSFGWEEGEGTESVASGILNDLSIVNIMFYEAILYVKVYRRLCKAAEYIAGALLTSSLFDSWKKHQ